MVKIHNGILFIILNTFCLLNQLSGQRVSLSEDQRYKNDFSARIENDILILENNYISRTYEWNNGNIITLSLTDKISGKVWQTDTNKPDLTFPGQTENAENAIFSSKVVTETAIVPEHLEAEISYTLDKLEIKRVFRIYRNISAIACDLYFRGESSGVWQQSVIKLADQANLEKLTASNAGKNSPVIEKIELPGKHWKLDAVEFSDITDGNNTLVFNIQALSYRPNIYRGNILFAHDNLSDNGIFILKEAPTSNVQLAYPGGDFITEFGKFMVIGAGLNPADLDPLEWRRGYGFATGVYSGGDINRLTALRDYQKNIRIHKPGRDEMILMNTWGDRGQDTRVREKFALAELEAGAKLGITHFQIDDGWQKGRSSNSALKGGSLDNIWKNNDYWEPDPVKFPSGLDPVVKRGKELGIEVCLWFNPSRENSNENWERDADVLIGMYKNHGIRTFKIDGVSLPDKLAEINFRKFLDKVSKETDHNVVFNLDVTAGRRGGYHYFNEYGNLFLENRYTDWQNYYPYTTLRNLWMLAKYVPTQNLQIEFLNKWRNPANYKDDPFAPANYSFEYIFAITLAAQPLAWFEATGLPEEAFAIAPVIKRYREIQFDFHSGNIFPIGEEPSGKSWTGFQSIQEGEGYFLVFREDNTESESTIKTWLNAGTKIRCIPELGKGAEFIATVGKGGSVLFTLNDKNSYALYRYIIK
jgi:alpha-galactosidase